MLSVKKRVALNLALLVFVALPLWIAIPFLLAVASPTEWMQETGFKWSVSDVYRVLPSMIGIMMPAFLVGGILHQVVVLSIPHTWPDRQVRAGVVLSTLVIPLFLAAVAPVPSTLLLPRILLSTGVAMLLYGLVADPLRQRRLPG